MTRIAHFILMLSASLALTAVMGECALLEQIHVAYGKGFDEMTVMWASDSMPLNPQVFYGPSPSNYSSSASGFVRFFTSGNSKGLQYHIVVPLSGLTPYRKYYYYCQTESNRSSEFSFLTRNDDPNFAPQFLFYGDLGHTNGGPTLPLLIREVENGYPTAVIHAGDFAYDLDTDDGHRGDEFMNYMQPVAANVPYMTCVGNHEVGYNYSHYTNRFAMPGDSLNMYYSFDIGRAHFIAYSTEVFFSHGPVTKEQQMNWLIQDLEAANANRNVRPWIIVYGHRPMYCSNADGDCPEDNPVRLELEPLFFKYGVDIILEAHEHSVEFLWPVYNNTVTQKDYINPKAPVHIITGFAGCNENAGLCLNPIFKKGGEWSAFYSWFFTYGYARMRVANETHFEFTQLIDVGGIVSHGITVVQTNHGPYAPLSV